MDFLCHCGIVSSVYPIRGGGITMITLAEYRKENPFDHSISIFEWKEITFHKWKRESIELAANKAREGELEEAILILCEALNTRIM